MSQTELSEASGLPKPMLSRYENDHVAPSLGTLKRLAEALVVTEGSLLGEEHPARPEELFIEALRTKGVTVSSAAEAEQLARLVADVRSRNTSSAG